MKKYFRQPITTDHNRLILLGVMLLGFITFNSCQKDRLLDEPTDQNVFNVSTQKIETRTSEDDSLQLTVLGEFRTNPFTVENMATAHNELYGTNLTVMPTTDLYVKFLPADVEDVKKLEDTDEFFYDYQLEYEVVEMGDYYFQPEDPEELPTLYAVVAPDFTFPQVTYQIIAELHVDYTDKDLVVRAMENTENDPGVLGFDPILEEGEGGGGGGNPPAAGPCQCPVYPNPRKPGGCIQVEDTMLGMEGVRRVKVITKDSWFQEDETWTDDQGCWKINEEYRGVMWMWVKFRSDRAKFRGAPAGWRSVYAWINTIKDYAGRFYGPVYNNIHLKYMHRNNGTTSHLYWGAATVGNALHEFYDNSGSGIIPPDSGLDVYLGRNNSYGYAVMDSQGQIATAAGIAITGVTFFTGPFAPLIGLVGGLGVVAYLPDVYVGIAYDDSDRLKRLAYHEFAHASHFVKAGNSFWNTLVWAEILAGGHGTSNSSNAPIISISESWAEFVARTYNHGRYPGGGSLPIGYNYELFLEEQRNDSPDHIPIGYYHDLIDSRNGGIPESTCDGQVTIGGCGLLVNDDVEGFSSGFLFSKLSPGVMSPQAFTNAIIQTNPTSNSSQQINNLFNSY